LYFYRTEKSRIQFVEICISQVSHADELGYSRTSTNYLPSLQVCSVMIQLRAAYLCFQLFSNTVVACSHVTANSNDM